jgi:hypothetical protein
VEAQEARQEEQWLGIMMSMQEREQKWEARHENDKLWRAGIMSINTKTIKGVAQGQEGRERASDMTVGTDGGGLGTS